MIILWNRMGKKQVSKKKKRGKRRWRGRRWWREGKRGGNNRKLRKMQSLWFGVEWMIEERIKCMRLVYKTCESGCRKRNIDVCTVAYVFGLNKYTGNLRCLEWQGSWHVCVCACVWVCRGKEWQKWRRGGRNETAGEVEWGRQTDTREKKRQRCAEMRRDRPVSSRREGKMEVIMKGRGRKTGQCCFPSLLLFL